MRRDARRSRSREAPNPIRTVGICSGGAARGIRLAASLGLDAWITGEPAEDSRALASELGVSFIAGGHYATETFGVRALASVLRATLRGRDDLPRRPEPRMRIHSNSLPSIRSVGYA